MTSGSYMAWRAGPGTSPANWSGVKVRMKEALCSSLMLRTPGAGGSRGGAHPGCARSTATVAGAQGRRTIERTAPAYAGWNRNDPRVEQKGRVTRARDRRPEIVHA